MNSLMKKIGLGLALGATALTAAAPAEAQRWGGYRGHGGYYRGGGAGTAVVAGIAGLAVGAALASNSNRGYYRDRGYYDGGYYRDRGYYHGYYAEPYYERRCFIERRWDGYYDRPVNVRVCR
ncbi:hypothetical protein [Sphingomonas sp. PAMC 26605]|uniref:hypothetical protein n=1 Tax=Sphingomonas sp. PAMC 26605 TaxID=1112214 RepID=UPI00026CD6C3|nr:hypothetical protein [Sphingomonas sp. PAMC 26605]